MYRVIESIFTYNLFQVKSSATYQRSSKKMMLKGALFNKVISYFSLSALPYQLLFFKLRVVLEYRLNLLILFQIIICLLRNWANIVAKEHNVMYKLNPDMVIMQHLKKQQSPAVMILPVKW